MRAHLIAASARCLIRLRRAWRTVIAGLSPPGRTRRLIQAFTTRST